MQLCRTILLIGLLGLPGVAAHGAAQDARETGVTVNDLVARALADNPDLQATQAEVDAARGRRWQAGLRPNPVLELGVQQNVTGPDNNLTAGVTVPLDLNGRKAGRIGVAEGELAIKRAQVADQARRLRAEVRRKAGELLAVQRNLRFTEALLQANREALALLHARVKRGAARQNLEVVRQTYTLGRATLLDAIAEQRRYIDIETGYTEALKQAYDAAVDIERAIGALEPEEQKGKVHEAAER